MLKHVQLAVFYVLMVIAIALQAYPMWFMFSDIVHYHAISVVSGMAYGSVVFFSIPSFLGSVICSYRIKIKYMLPVWITIYLSIHVVSILIFLLIPSKPF
jgi:hypothetical protein